MTPSRLAAAIAFSFVAWTCRAGAQSPPEPAPADGAGAADEPRAKAQPLFAKGMDLVQKQQWSDALEQFLQARAIYESAIISFNIGYCQRALGQYVDALATFRAFLASPLEGVAATRRSEAEAYVRELEARVAKLEIVLPSHLRGADVVVDGRSASPDARGAVVRVLDPGVHTVQVRHDGHRPLFVDRTLQAGASERIDVRLERLPARLVVASNVRAAKVVLDGRVIGTVPYDAEVVPGAHRLEVVADGYVPHGAALNLQPGGAARVTAQLRAEAASVLGRWWFWTGITALVAGAAVTTYVATRPEPEPPPYEKGNLGLIFSP